MQDEEATAGKTSSLKLKEPKIGILLPKLSAMPPGAVSKTKSIASSHLTFQPVLSPFTRSLFRGTNKFVDVYTEITEGDSARGRSIGCRKSDDEHADSTFREARTRSPNFASVVVKTITRGYQRATSTRNRIRFGEWKRTDLSMPR